MRPSFRSADDRPWPISTGSKFTDRTGQEGQEETQKGRENKTTPHTTMILATSISRRLPKLCAACARRVSAHNTTASTIPRTHFSTRRFSTTTILSPHHVRFSSSKPTHKPLSYYALFPQSLPSGPPPTGPFDIDVRALRREFLQLQAASHPDLHHHAAASPSSSSSRSQAEALSSHINAAYKTLSSPLARAQYLLSERYGYDLAGDEASSLTGPADPDLLTEVLYARETIEDAASEKDLDGVKKENDEKIRLSLRALADAFAAEDLQTAVRETVRLRYWENIAESIHNWEEGKPILLQH